MNKSLAVDLGGIHTSLNGSVTLHASNGTGAICENAAVGCANRTSKGMAPSIQRRDLLGDVKTYLLGATKALVH